MKDGIRES